MGYDEQAAYLARRKARMCVRKGCPNQTDGRVLCEEHRIKALHYYHSVVVTRRIREKSAAIG